MRENVHYWGFFSFQPMAIIGGLQAFVESGLHSEYPVVLLESALHTLRSTCYLDADALKAAYSRPDLDPFQTAVCVLSEHLKVFLNLFQRLHEIQEHAGAICRLIHRHLPSEIHHFEVAAVASLFTPDVHHSLEPFLYAYMLLELNAAESDTPDYNCFFESIVTSKLSTQLPSDLAEQCRHIFSLGPSEFSLHFLLEDLVKPFIESAFLHKTEELILNEYTSSFIGPLRDYLAHVVEKSWLKRINHIKTQSNPLTPQLAYTTYYCVRRQELFRVMMDYPESRPAVMDLKAYLMETHALQDLIDALGKEVRIRLLHPGVHTDEILMGYGCLVRGLREIDPSSVAQDIICQPVASCLRVRDDAVHCIVDRLITPPGHQNVVGDNEEDNQVTGLQKELLLPTPLEVEPTDEVRDGDAHLVAHESPQPLQ
uniref:Vacuolar protein sorting-associated protein 72 homolog n=1 Tax=Mesocestoides corti TaxID=53468 RepID=A0A5K3FBE7_MESCO